MYIYHGTSKKNLCSIDADGYVNEDSYWGTLEIAESYAKQFPDGVVLKTEFDDRFKANILLAQSLYDDGDIDFIPDEDDVVWSLAHLDSVVAIEKIRDYELI